MRDSRTCYPDSHLYHPSDYLKRSKDLFLHPQAAYSSPTPKERKKKKEKRGGWGDMSAGGKGAKLSGECCGAGAAGLAVVRPSSRVLMGCDGVGAS